MKTVIKSFFIGLVSIICIILLFGEDILLFYKEIKEGISSTLVIPTIKEIKVEIKGAVHRPGVYTVAEGTSLWDMINICGLKDSADTQTINFAQKLIDEQVYYIPYVNSASESSTQSTISTIEKESSSVRNSSIASKININKATYEELISLPGIGEVKANKVLAYIAGGKKIISYEEFVTIIGGLKNEYLEEVKDKTILE